MRVVLMISGEPEVKLRVCREKVGGIGSLVRGGEGNGGDGKEGGG